jgi:lipoprotein-anchoring transpeptidase ErfK/SrfK
MFFLSDEGRMSTQITDPAKTPQAGAAPASKGRAAQKKRGGRRRGGPRGLWLFWLALLLLIALIGAGAYAYTWGNGFYQSDRILPGVHVWGINLGGQTTEQASGTLASEWEKRKLALQDGEQRWILPPDKLGILFDAEATVRDAHAALRQEGDPDQPRQVVRQLIANAISQEPSVQRIAREYDPTLAAPKRIEVSPVWRFDEAPAAETLRTLAGQIETLPQEATVKVVDGRVEGTASSSGRALDISTSLALAEQLAGKVALAPASDGENATQAEIVRLPIVPLEPVVKDVSSVVAEASQLLSNTLSMALYDPITDERFSWTFTPETTSQWLAFSPVPTDPSKVQLSVDEAKVSATLKEQEDALGGGRYVDRQLALPDLVEAFRSGKPATAQQRLYHYAKTHAVQSGETLTGIGFDYGMPYGWIMAANPGMDEKVMAGQKVTIPSQDNLLPMPVMENKRIKVSISDQRMQAYEDGVLKWDWPASTGIKSSPTNPGVFQIQSHEANAYAARWNLSMPYFMGIYRPVPSVDFMNGFHGFPSRNQNQILWTKNLGSPITFGCIMVSTDNAKLLYDWAEDGVIVEITK